LGLGFVLEFLGFLKLICLYRGTKSLHRYFWVILYAFVFFERWFSWFLD